MDRQRSDDSAKLFAAYLDELASVIGHAARIDPLRDYCTGLLLPCGRKSVEPIAAAPAPARVSAQLDPKSCSGNLQIPAGYRPRGSAAPA